MHDEASDEVSEATFESIVKNLEIKALDEKEESHIDFLNQITDLYREILLSVMSPTAELMLDEIQTSKKDESPVVDLSSRFWEDSNFELDEYLFTESMLFRIRLAKVTRIHLLLEGANELTWSILYRLVTSMMLPCLTSFRETVSQNSYLDESELGSHYDTLHNFSEFSAFKPLRSEVGERFWLTYEEGFLRRFEPKQLGDEEVAKLFDEMKLMLTSESTSNKVMSLLDIASVQVMILMSICKMFEECNFEESIEDFVGSARSVIMTEYMKMVAE